MLSDFERHFTVHSVDRRGRGASGDSDNYAVPREFEDVANVVDSIAEPVNLLAHSFGAVCALEAALLTSNIRKMVLYEPVFPATAGSSEAAIVDRMQALLDAGDREGVVVTLIRDFVRVPALDIEHLRSLPAWAGRVAAAHTIPREMRTGGYRFDPRRFRRLTSPVLLLLGGDSPPATKEVTKVVSAALPGSQIGTMPGQQHTAPAVV